MLWDQILMQLRIKYSGLGLTDRFKRLDLLERFLRGTQYAELTVPFYNSFNSTTEFVPIRERRPALVYNVAKVIVDRSVDMLFGDSHFPEVHIEGETDKDTEKILKTLIRESNLPNIFKKAAKMGSVGSVFVFFKFIDGKVYHEVLNTKYCTPTFHPRIPGELLSVSEQKIVMGDELIPFGYTNLKPEAQYVYRRDITTTEEIEYYPVEYGLDLLEAGPQFNRRNNERSFAHNFGFVPGVWVRNLEGEDPIDGESTFESLLDLQVELDYQMSNLGKVLQYCGEPTMLIKDANFADDDVLRQIGNAFMLSEQGDAKYIELNGHSQEIILKYIDKLRSTAMELARGNRVNPEKLNAAQSGKALALLHKDIIGLVSELRLSYGEYGLMMYFRKMLLAYSKMTTNYPIIKGLKANPDAHIVLRWGDYFETTSDDDKSQFDALKTGVEAGIISQERATMQIADRFAIENVQAERALISKEKEEQLKMINELDQNQQVAQKMKSNQV